MPLNNFFLIKFLAVYFGDASLILFQYLVCKKMIFKSQMILSYVLPMNKTIECKGHPIHPKILRNSCKKEA